MNTKALGPIMYSPTLGRDIDLGDYFVSDHELECLMTDLENFSRDMAPGIRRKLESLIRSNF